jgi:hypothetical protein
MTDGDNLQWMLGSFLQSSWFGSSDLDSTAMGFTIAPSLKDIAPTALSHIYASASKLNITSFVASPSGLGYIYPEHLNSDVLQVFADQTAAYMASTGMRLLNILAEGDNVADVIILKSCEPFLAHSNIDAVIYYTYGCGYACGSGKALFASNGKPIITARYQYHLPKRYMRASQFISVMCMVFLIVYIVFAGKHPTDQ